MTDAELDHTLGLLLLREGEQLGIISTAAVRRWLHEDFPVGPVLASFCERSWCDMVPDVPFEPGSPQQGASGLRVRASDVGGHAPRYVRTSPTDAAGAVVGLEIEDLRSGGKLVYAPCLGSFSDRLAAAVAGADCVLLDGTFWDNDELLRAGGARTALQTGHWPVGGAAGSLAWLAHLPVRHRVYVHINNTNPMLRLGSPERHQVESAGVRVGMDGDEFHL